MDLRSSLASLASSLAVGSAGYFDCPKCGRQRKLGMSHKADGAVYQCFSASCGISGIIATNVMSRRSISESLNKSSRSVLPAFRLPDYWINGFASEASLKMAVRYDLMPAYTNGELKTAYDPKLLRQVFYYTDTTGKHVGAFGRALYYGTKPKAYIYPYSVKTPIEIGKNKTGVIVEDLFSAVKAYNVGYTGISLSGTTLPLSYIEYLKKYNKLIICLDKDATLKSIKIKKMLDFICKDVVVLPLKKDLKDLPNDDVRNILYV